MTKTSPLPLMLAPGWKSVAPRACGKKLLWLERHQLCLGETDFSQPAMLGEVGPVDCPMAIDPVRRLVFRYRSAHGYERRDFSELGAWHLDLGTAQKIFSLGLHQWALWFCAFLPKRDAIVALVASELPSRAGLNIQHQLGVFSLRSREVFQIRLPADCFFPLAFDESREEVLFHGATGYQLVTIKGERERKVAQSKHLPIGRGAARHPRKRRYVLGGDGLAEWDIEDNTIVELRENGLCPVWHPDGKRLFFCESSSDLHLFDYETGRAERILKVAGNPYEEINLARPAVISPDGTHLAVTLTRRVRRRKLAEETSRTDGEWSSIHSIAVLDLMRQELWQTSGFSPQLAWYEPLTYEF